MDDKPRKELMDTLSIRYQDGKYSDLAIVCGETTYRVHKLVVCSRSAFFAKACDGPFQEAQTGVINLPEDDPTAVRLMIHYLYHLDYPYIYLSGDVHDVGAMEILPAGVDRPGSAVGSTWADCLDCSKVSSSPEDIEPPLQPEPYPELELEHRPAPLAFFKSSETNLILHARVYALAEKFIIEGLKDVALKKFEMELHTDWNTQDFLQATEVVYESTPESVRGMRDVVVKTFHEHNLLGQEGVKEYIRDFADLVYDLLVYSHNHKQGCQIHKFCFSCGTGRTDVMWEDSEDEVWN